jgi:hypothetical protein
MPRDISACTNLRCSSRAHCARFRMHWADPERQVFAAFDPKGKAYCDAFISIEELPWDLVPIGESEERAKSR